MRSCDSERCAVAFSCSCGVTLKRATYPVYCNCGKVYSANGVEKQERVLNVFCKCGYWATSAITQELQCPICNTTMLVRSKRTKAGMHGKSRTRNGNQRPSGMRAGRN